MTNTNPTPSGPTSPQEFLTAASDASNPPADSLAKANPALNPADKDDAQKLAIEIARLFDEDKCTGVLVLDVQTISPITSFLVIGSGTSERQMRSVIDHAVDLTQELGSDAFFVTKDSGAHWLVADFVHVVAHLFEPNTRAHYNLEMLWGDAPRIDWHRPA